MNNLFNPQKIRNYLHKNWFDAKFLPRKNLLLILVLLNLILYLFLYRIFAADLLMDIKNLRNSNLSAIEVFAAADFLAKQEALRKNLANTDFKKLIAMNKKAFISFIQTSANSLNLDNFSIKNKQLSQNSLNFEIANLLDWDEFLQVLTKLDILTNRFFWQDFSLIYNAKNAQIDFKFNLRDKFLNLDLQEIRTDFANLNQLIEISETVPESKFSAWQKNLIANQPPATADTQELAALILFNKIFNLPDFTPHNSSQDFLAMANPFAEQQIFASHKQDFSVAKQQNSHSQTSKKPKLELDKLELVAILASDNKKLATIMTGENTYQTISQGEYLRGSKIKLTRIYNNNSTVILQNSKTKQTKKLFVQKK